MNKLKVGDKVPYFKLLNQNGKLVDIEAHLGSPIVLFFYPKDDTPGCTKEVCAFRDEHIRFAEAGTTVFGISGDSVKSHNSFKSKFNLPYDLLADEDNKIRKAFGVPSNLFGFIPGRVTYIIDDQGIIRHIFNDQLNSEKHVQESLKIINSLKSVTEMTK